MTRQETPTDTFTFTQYNGKTWCQVNGSHMFSVTKTQELNPLPEAVAYHTIWQAKPRGVTVRADTRKEVTRLAAQSLRDRGFTV